MSDMYVASTHFLYVGVKDDFTTSDGKDGSIVFGQMFGDLWDKGCQLTDLDALARGF